MAFRNNERGLTLTEMIIAMAIAAMLIMAVVPGMTDLINNNSLSAQNNALADAFMLARSEAIKRAQSVGVCSSTNGSSCSGDTDWANGWLVWSDDNGDNVVNTGEEVIQVNDALGGQSSFASQQSIAVVQFLAQGFANMSAGAQRNFNLCDQRSGESGYQLTVRPSGQISTSRITCG